MIKIRKRNALAKGRKKKAAALLLAVSLLVAIEPGTIRADYIAGQGSREGDLVITTAEEFNSFASSVTNGETYLGKTVRLGADIDFSGSGVTMAGNGKSKKISFNGTFEGDGHTISGISDGLSAGLSSGCAGLFSVTGEDAVIRNLKLSRIDLSIQKGDNAGILVGYHQGVLENCKVVDSKISTSTSVKHLGGLAGDNSGGKIYHCMNVNTSVVMSQGTSCGGIVGSMGGRGTEIAQCGFTGNVEGGKYAGGVVGFMGAFSTLQNCYSAGNIESPRNNKTGGIAGVAQASLSDCYYAADLSEEAYGEDAGSLSVSNVMGKTSYEMTSQGFLDLLNAADNGNAEDIPWAFGAGCNYPQPADVYAIDIATAEGGFVNCATTYACEGREISFWVGANARYLLEDVSVATDYGEKVEAGQSGEEYTFIMPKSPVVIEAKFAPSAMPTPTIETAETPIPTAEATETPSPKPTAAVETPSPVPTTAATPSPKPTVAATWTPSPVQDVEEVDELDGMPNETEESIATGAPDMDEEPDEAEEPGETPADDMTAITPTPDKAPDSAAATKTKKQDAPQVKKTVTLKAGAKKKINVKGSFIISKIFKSTNKKVASVNKKGVVKAKKKGKCNIKVTVKYYKKNNAKKVVKKVLVTKVTVR